MRLSLIKVPQELIATTFAAAKIWLHVVFLTGEPGCGKTTAIKRTCEILQMKMKIGGVVSGEIREGGVRVGFSLEDIMTHEKGILAHINQGEGPRVREIPGQPDGYSKGGSQSD